MKNMFFEAKERNNEFECEREEKSRVRVSALAPTFTLLFVAPPMQFEN